MQNLKSAIPIRYLIYFSYNGQYYHGYQKQANSYRTVQGILETAIMLLNPSCNISLRASSRTDAGVHALRAAAHFDLSHYEEGKLWTPAYIKSKLNKLLTQCNEHIKIESVSIVPATFDARYDTIAKTYNYIIALPKEGRKTDKNGNSTKESVRHLNLKPSYEEPIWLRNAVFAFRAPNFDHEAVKEGISLFTGPHNYTTFSSNSKQNSDSPPIRTERSIEIASYEPISTPIFDKRQSLVNHFLNFDQLSYYRFVFQSRGFMYKQVRKMVAALLCLGNGTMTKDEIRYMLENPSFKNWNSRIEIAPPGGLYLKKVDYNVKDLEAFTKESPAYQYTQDGTIL